jgi:hypothetical protein
MHVNCTPLASKSGKRTPMPRAGTRSLVRSRKIVVCAHTQPQLAYDACRSWAGVLQEEWRKLGCLVSTAKLGVSNLTIADAALWICPRLCLFLDEAEATISGAAPLVTRLRIVCNQYWQRKYARPFSHARLPPISSFTVQSMLCLFERLPYSNARLSPCPTVYADCQERVYNV